MNLDELEQLAKKVHRPYDLICRNADQSRYFHSANPETVLKLIAVARAAPKGCTCGIAIGDPRIKEHPEHCRKLMEALAALEDE